MTYVKAETCRHNVISKWMQKKYFWKSKLELVRGRGREFDELTEGLRRLELCYD